MNKTEIRFVSGFEPDAAVPRAVKTAALSHRFAVIQDSYRPDSADMFFDEPLWLRLLDFARQYASGADVAIMESDGTTTHEPDAFLARWQTRAVEDREPMAIAVHDAGRLVLWIEPEFWTSVGGPAPYHDSYTYALYANEDVSSRVMAFLAQADAAQGWDLSGEISPPSPSLPFWKKVLRRLT